MTYKFEFFISMDKFPKLSFEQWQDLEKKISQAISEFPGFNTFSMADFSVIEAD